MPNDRELDDWITGYVEYTESSEAPKLFRKWVAISTVAAALERKVWLEMGLETFYPNLYVILVGPSGSRKGTAMKPAKDIMTEVGIDLTSQSTTKEALAEELATSQQMTDMGDVDSVNEAMVTHSSVTVYNEELAVLFKHNDPDLIMWLTAWHDCEDNWSRSTKTQGSSEIVGVWVNLLGAMTPELVKAYMPETAIGGGLTGRIIFVYAHEKGKIVPLPFQSPEQEKLFGPLVRDLDRISSLKGQFSYTETFLEEWDKWVREEEEKQLFDEPDLDPYVNRRRAHALKLCMILAASEGNKLTLTHGLLKRAVGVLSRVEKTMPNTFSGVGSGQNARTLSNVAQYLAKKGTATKADLLRRFHKDVDDKRQLSEVLGTLEEMEFIEQEVDPNKGEVTYIVDQESKLAQRFPSNGEQG